MTEPTFVEADLTFKDVFKPLDGIWKGTFYIYQHQEGQKEGAVDHNMLDEKIFADRSLRLSDSLSVVQIYHSKTPYYQTVEITDLYIKDGDTSVVNSKGANKVEQGRMWCVVEKPDEKIVHDGAMEGNHTIIWSRNETAPLRKEYFKERVFEDSYQIIGYGYYGSDDPTLLPKTWFLANYHRVSDYQR